MGDEIAPVPVLLAHKDYRLNQIVTCFTLKNLFTEPIFLKKPSFSASC
jgi:hypothetical protein